MSTVAPYHTDALIDRSTHSHVYHDHDDCPDGQAIKPEHRIAGTGGKPHCKTCQNLASSM